MLSKIKSLAVGLVLAAFTLTPKVQAQSQLLIAGTLNGGTNNVLAAATNTYAPLANAFFVGRSGGQIALSFTYLFNTNVAVSTPPLARIYTSVDGANWATNQYVVALTTNTIGATNFFTINTNLNVGAVPWVAIGAVENAGNAASVTAGSISNLVAKAWGLTGAN